MTTLSTFSFQHLWNDFVFVLCQHCFSRGTVLVSRKGQAVPRAGSGNPTCSRAESCQRRHRTAPMPAGGPCPSPRACREGYNGTVSECGHGAISPAMHVLVLVAAYTCSERCFTLVRCGTLS